MIKNVREWGSGNSELHSQCEHLLSERQIACCLDEEKQNSLLEIYRRFLETSSSGRKNMSQNRNQNS